MKRDGEVSRVTIDRLSLYFRELRELYREGFDVISSDSLGRRAGFLPGQIRKDLAKFGEFGKKGLGYNIADLIRNISIILGLHQRINVAIIGVGNLGRALAGNSKLICINFNLVAIFDNDQEKVGKSLNGIRISGVDCLEALIKERNIQIAVITSPATLAQSVANRAIAAGIRGIWNFAPVAIKVPDNIALVSEDLSSGLASLYYYLSKTEIGPTRINGLPRAK